ncbi:type II toxin-antitoxin system PemK/MazF family toxin [Companilactobacillus huachuanensis]|uniref:Type II toxin-antitoxin system PemK/MazF family toxin n=1 Tax=Companilactobacillus huachuanensis TaxID=2559914 RepID=A0ABW1RKF8_9LACO|nr:type II toxin-antitoxin system PemK/MazF family toxin [Companilactobacillus huachuanensis]
MKYPIQGDIIFIDAKPHAGHELGGHSIDSSNIRRPMVVLSDSDYNEATGLVSGMPITSHNFFENNDGSYIPIMDLDSGIKGNVVTYYLPSYDFIARHGEIMGHVSNTMLKKLIDNVSYIFNI